MEKLCADSRDEKDSVARDDLNVDALMRLVLRSLPVNPVSYPSTAPMDTLQIQQFCVRHSALHFSKTAGQLAAIAEAADHGAELKTDSLKKIAVNSVVNALKLADEIGLSAQEIADHIKSKYL